MKNVTNLLAAAFALFSLSSSAVLIQPVTPVSEDAPFRISTALKTGIHNTANGVGLRNIGGGIAFAHNVGYDFQWGLAASYDWAALGKNRLFVQNEGDAAASRVEAELSLSFMPEVAEKLHIGGLFGFGWAGMFGDKAKALADGMGIAKFGELNLRVNLGLSYCFTDMFGIYFAPGYTLSQIRFAADGTDDTKKKIIKDNSSLSGIELPVGFYIAASENVGVYLDVNTKFVDLRGDRVKDSWREDFTLGLAFSM